MPAFLPLGEFAPAGDDDGHAGLPCRAVRPQVETEEETVQDVRRVHPQHVPHARLVSQVPAAAQIEHAHIGAGAARIADERAFFVGTDEGQFELFAEFAQQVEQLDFRAADAHARHNIGDARRPFHARDSSSPAIRGAAALRLKRASTAARAALPNVLR